MSFRDCDAIVIGAGIAGASAAKQLGEQGKHVVLFDRSFDEPDRIVGELMQPAGLELMAKMGLEDCVKDIGAVEEQGYQILFENEWLRMPFPPCLQNTEYTPARKEGDITRYHGCSFHHGRLVQNLRAAARKTPGVELVAGAVTELLWEGGRVVGVRYRTVGEADGEEFRTDRFLRAALVIVADGCLSKFRKFAHYDKPETVSHFAGVLLEDVTLDHENHGLVVITKTTPTLLYRIGSNTVRVLVDIPLVKLPGREELRRMLLEETLPQLPASVQEAFRTAVIKGPVRSMPCMKLHPNAKIIPGLLLVGDALNTRHPLTGAGMTCALTDAWLMREFESVNFSSTREISSAVQQIYQQHNKLTATMNILSFALYRVFSGPYALRAAICAYLKEGGANVEGPMSLLSGLETEHNAFLYHYSRVGLHGLKTILPNMIQCMHVGYVAMHIVVPLMYKELVKPYFWAPQLPNPVEDGDAHHDEGETMKHSSSSQLCSSGENLKVD